MERIRLIAMDMDGTLLSRAPEGIPPTNAEALRTAAEQGIHLAIASGRLPDDAGFFALDAGVPMHVLALNGGVTLMEPQGEALDTRFMEEKAARRTRQMIEEAGLAYSLFSVHDLALSEPMKNPRREMIWYGTHLDRPGSRTQLWQEPERIEPLMERVSKYVVISEERPEALAKLKARLDAEVPEVEVTSSWGNNIEIMPAGMNKGVALTALAGRLGISMEQVMAIGDHDNDVSMLDAAGCAVAMANGSPAAKAAAHWIAPTNTQCGVAAAIRGLALGDGEAMLQLREGLRHNLLK